MKLLCFSSQARGRALFTQNNILVYNMFMFVYFACSSYQATCVQIRSYVDCNSVHTLDAGKTAEWIEGRDINDITQKEKVWQQHRRATLSDRVECALDENMCVDRVFTLVIIYEYIFFWGVVCYLWLVFLYKISPNVYKSAYFLYVLVYYTHLPRRYQCCCLVYQKVHECFKIGCVCIIYINTHFKVC